MLKIAFSPIYKYDLPLGHRFPMDKYELLPMQLLLEGSVSEDNFFHPVPLRDSEILLTRPHRISTPTHGHTGYDQIHHW